MNLNLAEMMIINPDNAIQTWNRDDFVCPNCDLFEDCYRCWGIGDKDPVYCLQEILDLNRPKINSSIQYGMFELFELKWDWNDIMIWLFMKQVFA